MLQRKGGKMQTKYHQTEKGSHFENIAFEKGLTLPDTIIKL